MNSIKTPIIAAATVVMLTLGSCSTPKNVAYVQDMTNGNTERIANVNEITVRPDDKISIVVKSKDPMLADLFNLPIVAHHVGYTQQSSLSQSQQVSTYTVDSKGDIDFPVLGTVHVAGMDRAQIASHIKSELINRKLISDPVVTVEFANLYFSVLGEVTHPGRYAIDNDKVTIFDAISLAGDLTIYGERENVVVMRDDGNGNITSYRVNLTNASGIAQSPVYYLQQKDVVYVEPNPTRARQSTVNGNNLRSTSFWISLASLLTTVAVLIFK